MKEGIQKTYIEYRELGFGYWELGFYAEWLTEFDTQPFRNLSGIYTIRLIPNSPFLIPAE